MRHQSVVSKFVVDGKRVGRVFDRETACRVAACALQGLALCCAAALAMPLAFDGQPLASLLSATLLMVLWAGISTCTWSKQVCVGSVLFGALWLRPVSRSSSLDAITSYDWVVAWMCASLGFTASIGAASIRLPERALTLELAWLRVAASTLNPLSLASSAEHLLAAFGHLPWLLKAIRCWCVACTLSVEVAMLPGAMLSIVTTAVLTALGGDLDHEVDPQSTCSTRAAAAPRPLVVLFHGHGFNSAMWGRFITSLSLADYSTVTVSYELHNALMSSPAPDEGIAELAVVAAREVAIQLSTHGTCVSHALGRPTIFIGHSIGGLVATHIATHGAAKQMGLDVKGVIAISAPFAGVPALAVLGTWPTLSNAPALIRDLLPGSHVCAELCGAAQRHAAVTGCKYRYIAGWCDCVVPASTAFAAHVADTDGAAMLAPLAPFAGQLTSACLLLASEGHFTITMSDRLIQNVVQWVGDLLQPDPPCHQSHTPNIAAAATAAKEAAQAADKAAQQTALEAHLTANLGGGDESPGASNESIIEWISENAAALEDVSIARTVMRCVLETSTTETPPSAPKVTKQIERRKLLLLKYTASGAEADVLRAQAAWLYEVQAYCGRKSWPQGLIKKVFYNLYETDIVFEDAYSVWREDVSDETPGKDRALFQVNEFLQWLAEAAEEEEGDGE